MQDINPRGQNRVAGHKNYTLDSRGESSDSTIEQPRKSNLTDVYGGSEHAPSIRLSTEDLSAATQNNEPFSSSSPPSYFSNFNHYATRHNAELAVTQQTSAPSVQKASLIPDLSLKTDLHRARRRSSLGSIDAEPRLLSSASAASLTQRIPSVRSWLNSTAGSISPGSAISSPQIAAMLDLTPLPSPNLMPLESWKLYTRTRSRASSASSRTESFVPISPNPSSALSLTLPRKKHHSNLIIQHRGPEERHPSDEVGHSRKRSVSDYLPEQSVPAKPRKHAVSTSIPSYDPQLSSKNIRREEYLATSRGILCTPSPFDQAPTMDEGSSRTDEAADRPLRSSATIYRAKNIGTGITTLYEPLRLLGQGTFSKVYLGLRLASDQGADIDYNQESTSLAGVRARSRRLVAIKVIESGPAGGADAERIAISLKREVELMKMVHHPSIIHLKAFSKDDSGRALLIVNYCPGGDLFDLTSQHLDVLTASLIRRIFSELVSAVRYLHQKYIVHRDIKLENVLLNIPVQVHADVADWQKLDRAVVTLTDLGLGREIPRPPESPMLETRCGSEDYAAPEILMGSPYDGRQTDAWALGVLLYALMEGRLPFDALPGTRGDAATLKARTPHRVARCEWGWVKYGDEDFEWDSTKGEELEGARHVVDGLLRRNTRRVALSEIREISWVRDGITIDGGLRWVEAERI